MLSETIIICSTVLLVVAGVLVFAHRWFYTTRNKNETLIVVKNLQESVKKVHDSQNEKIEQLGKNDLALADEVKKFQIAANLVQTGKNSNLQAALQTIRQQTGQ